MWRRVLMRDRERTESPEVPGTPTTTSGLNRRRFLGVLAVGGGSVGLAGVGGLTESTARAISRDAYPGGVEAAIVAARQEPTPGGVLTIGLGEQPSTHNPYGGISNRTTISQFL